MSIRLLAGGDIVFRQFLADFYLVYSCQRHFLMVQAKTFFLSQQTMAFLGGVDTACGTQVDISSSLLSQSLGACWVLFFFLAIGRPPLHSWENFEHTVHCSDVSDGSNSFHRNDVFSLSECTDWSVSMMKQVNLAPNEEHKTLFQQ